jgi:hypothetical protein
MPLCSAGSAHEYLGWNLTAIVTSVQNGDNSPSTAPGIEYLGTVGQRGAAVAADERGHAPTRSTTGKRLHDLLKASASTAWLRW